MTTIPDAMYEKVYEHFAQAAVRYFNAKGEQAPFFFAVQINAAANEFTCLGAVPSEASAMFYRNEAARNHIKYLISAFLSDASPLRQQLAEDNQAPDLIIQVVEVWLAHQIYAKGDKIDLTQPPPLPSESPDRREAVAVMVHSLNRTVVGYCPIGGSPRQASYAPCDLAGGLTGRMSMNPLPSEDATITKH